MNKIAHFLVAAAAGATLVSCAAPGPEAYGPFPSNYKDVVAEQVRADFFDPSSLQDVWISAPAQATMVFTPGWIVCLRANGKNRYGAYSGRQEYGYLINNGQVVQEGDHVSCPSAHYERWREMEMTGTSR